MLIETLKRREDIAHRELYTVPIDVYDKLKRPAMGDCGQIILKAVKYRKNLGYDSFETTWLAEKLQEPVWGIYIGYRTVADGVSRRYEDSQPDFSPRSHRRVLLFAIHPRKNPILVFPETVNLFWKNPLTITETGIQYSISLE